MCVFVCTCPSHLFLLTPPVQSSNPSLSSHTPTNTHMKTHTQRRSGTALHKEIKSCSLGRCNLKAILPQHAKTYKHKQQDSLSLNNKQKCLSYISNVWWNCIHLGQTWSMGQILKSTEVCVKQNNKYVFWVFHITEKCVINYPAKFKWLQNL